MVEKTTSETNKISDLVKKNWGEFEKLDSNKSDSFDQQLSDQHLRVLQIVNEFPDITTFGVLRKILSRGFVRETPIAQEINRAQYPGKQTPADLAPNELSRQEFQNIFPAENDRKAMMIVVSSAIRVLLDRMHWIYGPEKDEKGDIDGYTINKDGKDVLAAIYPPASLKPVSQV